MPKSLIFLFFFAYLAQSKLNRNQNQIEKYLWKGVEASSKKESMNVLFHCKTKKSLQVILTEPQKSQDKEGEIAIIRMITGNVPPSGKGHKKFIHTGRSSKNKGTFNVILDDVPRFIEDLKTLQTQTIKNKKMAMEEFTEKVNYCEGLPEKKRDTCHAGSSRYQVAEPHILLWITYEEITKPLFYFIFKPYEIKNLKKLSCYSS